MEFFAVLNTTIETMSASANNKGKNQAAVTLTQDDSDSSLEVMEYTEDELLSESSALNKIASVNTDKLSMKDVMQLLTSVASTTNKIEAYMSKNDKRVAAVEEKAELTDYKVDLLTSTYIR